MYIKVINEMSNNSNIAQLFLKNIDITVDYRYSKGATGLNQVLICKNIDNLASTSKFNYGFLGTLQFNLTYEGNAIPYNETDKNIAWCNYKTGTLIDINRDYYEILDVKLVKSNYDVFSGRITLRYVKDIEIVSNSQGTSFTGKHVYLFELRNYNSSIDK